MFHYKACKLWQNDMLPIKWNDDKPFRQNYCIAPLISWDLQKKISVENFSQLFTFTQPHFRNSVNRKPFLVWTIFLAHQNFLECHQTSQMPSRRLMEAYNKYFICCQFNTIICSLTAILSWVILVILPPIIDFPLIDIFLLHKKFHVSQVRTTLQKQKIW